MADNYFRYAFRISENVAKDALAAVLDGKRSKYFSRASDGSASLRFNGFRINEEKVELLLDGEPVAYMGLPDLYAGYTLTIDGRGSMIGKYKFTITGA